jgi:molecular chaperone GrpE
MTAQPERPDEKPGVDNNAEAAAADEPVAAAEAQPKTPESAETDPQTAIAELTAKADEHWNRYLRTAAELENVRKRATRDVENARKYALEQFGKDLLAVKDSLEMGLAVENADAKSLRDGSKATLKMLAASLERFGIVEIDPAGEPFDPEFHEAMTMQPAPDAEPGSVVTVVQKGYTLNGRLLRPAMVIVAAEA